MKTLRIAMVEPASIDPGRLSDGPGRKVVTNMFTGLTSLDEDGNIVPGCARSWTASADARQWTFELQPNLRWSDGTPITASTFIESWRRATAPTTENPMADMFDIISGAKERRSGSTDVSLGLSSESPTILRIHTIRPMPDLTRRLAEAWAVPVPMHVIAAHGKKWMSPNHIVVNGPYILSEYKPDVSMTFTKNAASTVSTSIERVTLFFTDNPVDAKRWFELNKVDWADNLVPKNAIATLRQRANSPLRTTPYLGLTYVIPNTRRPTINLPFRQALNLSVDRTRLVKHILDGSQVPLSRPIPRDLLKSAPGPGLKPALARRILATSPTTRASAIELSFYNGGRNPELAAALQRGWKDTLGIDIRLRGLEWKTFLESTARGDFDLALFTLGGYDAADLLSVFSSESPNNRGSYRSTTVDKNLAAAALASTEQEHQRLLARAEATLAADVAVIALFQLTRHSIIRNELSGWRGNMRDQHPWRFLNWR